MCSGASGCAQARRSAAIHASITQKKATVTNTKWHLRQRLRPALENANTGYRRFHFKAIAMTKKEKLELERLQRLLEAERERSEKAWSGYRDALYELVDLKMKLERIEKVLRGDE